ncbi:hypothetical protein [Mesonia sp.]|uniref:hypothetical protein n=1 Tax=Mesonia sp. TaxID=1960830 RepID=UPI0017726B3E|nr:hypothetical protein [Mesonia sp.]HIB37987.1 hypothetical protein [Mesonia sp.]
MIQDFFLQHLGELATALIAGFCGWLFQRKQKHAELEALKADNGQKIIDLYQESLDDLKKRYEERFTELHREVELLRKNVELWKNKYRDLKKEFDLYRTKHP